MEPNSPVSVVLSMSPGTNVLTHHVVAIHDPLVHIFDDFSSSLHKLPQYSEYSTCTPILRRLRTQETRSTQFGDFTYQYSVPNRC